MRTPSVCWCLVQFQEESQTGLTPAVSSNQEAVGSEAEGGGAGIELTSRLVPFPGAC